MTDQQEMELPLAPIGETGTVEYRLRKRLTKVRQTLERLTAATGELPADSNGTVSAKEFNAAYRLATHVLQEEMLEPNY
jgi:hypothetical protein